MTDSVRHSGFSPASSGTAFDPVDDISRPEVDELDDFGIDPAELDDEDLVRELHSLHRTRLDTLRHAADTALGTHLRRTAELETEYLNRHPVREVDPGRLRDGA